LELGLLLYHSSPVALHLHLEKQAGGRGNMKCKSWELINNIVSIAQKNMRCTHIPKMSFGSIVGIPSILKKYENNKFSEFCHFVWIFIKCDWFQTFATKLHNVHRFKYFGASFFIESYRSISNLIEFDKINFGLIMPRSVSTGKSEWHILIG
jgi:hypothetical protein